MTRRRRGALIACAGLFTITAASTGWPTGSGATAVSSSPPPAFSASETISRVHLVNGADQPVPGDVNRTVSVTVSQTQNLRDRQDVTVTWAGAHPTGGLVTDHNSAAAALQEYPVVVMQCRGVDSATVSAANQVSPETCWTQTPAERFQYSPNTDFPAYRMDRYATTADRASVVNRPASVSSTQCAPQAQEHWIPFVAANGTTYPGGNLGCGGMAPEAANSTDSLQPGNTTYGVADVHGAGSTKFVMQTAETNASVGCSVTVTCTLEIIPIIGISCDAAGTAPAPGGMAPADRPTDQSTIDAIYADCSAPPAFLPGVFNPSQQAPTLGVSGQLWWAASNWRNRIAVPLTFAPSASVCNVVNNQATVYVYGAESMVQATQQWAPSFCLNPNLFTLRHIQTSEPQAKNLVSIGNVEAAFQAGPPAIPFTKPTVQAPAAVSGWAIAVSIDGTDGNPYPNVRLNARLLAKLLSESYRTCTGDCLDFTSFDSIDSGFAAMATNPFDMSRDPEFQALNPGIPPTNYLQSAATLSFMSSDSDIMNALTSYINADPEARAWLDGKRDPWGMIVNPAYRHIALPVNNWPLLDTHLQKPSTNNQCLLNSPVPWLPLVSSPVSNPATIALDMQFDIANSQINCANNGTNLQKLTGLGRQTPGVRFLLGLVSLADAARYQLTTAQLQTQNTSTSTGMFSDATGRSFVGPTGSALQAGADLLAPDDSSGTWLVPYNTLRTARAGIAAYPGTVLISIDVPTKGLPAGDGARYAQLLRFAAGPGQTAGLGNGQLPPGYLPITAANGLGALAGYTLKAADAVAAQQCDVPLVSGKAGSAISCPSSTGATPPKSAGSTSTAGAAIAPKFLAPTVTLPKGFSTSTPSSTAPSSAPAAIAVGKTTRLTSGLLGLALPALALMGLVALCGAAWTSGVGRR